jgi:tetratricopeptide (TPR) repeat protein
LVIIVIATNPVRGLFKAYYSWDEGHKIYQMGMYVESLESFEEAYPHLKNNGEFLIMYGKALSMAEKYGKAIQVLQEASNYQKNTILYNALGDSYKATGEFKKAESAYLKAYHMLPGRFYSKYLLAILYRDTGQKEKALSTARELMEKEVKIPSMAIEEIRAEMQKTILGQEADR